MARWLRKQPPEVIAQVQGRAGAEIATILDDEPRRRKFFSWLLLRSAFRRVRRELVATIAWTLGGRAHRAAYLQGLFRQSGEIHRVMYDRYSLAALLAEVGFTDVRCVKADQSSIEGFSECGLDVHDGMTRKPDSLFMEARRP